MRVVPASVEEMARELGVTEEESREGYRELLAKGFLRPVWAPGSIGPGCRYLLISAQGEDPVYVALGGLPEQLSPALEERVEAARRDPDLPLGSVWLARAMAVCADADGRCTSDQVEDYLGAPRGALRE